MHAILASLGTDGDVFPYIALADALRRRGHRVTLVASTSYGNVAAQFGLEFQELMSDRDLDVVLHNPDFWHPIKGPLIASRWGVDFIDQQYATLAELAADEDSILVASPAVVAARLVQEKFSRPMATVILQPWMIKSISAPPVMPGGWTLPRWTPQLIGRAYWRAVDAVGDLLIARKLNRVRRSIDLKPVRRLFEWWISPECILGMFPDWYGQPQDDWPRQIRIVGFPMFDGTASVELPADLADFCRVGTPPIAFTFGTGMMHAQNAYGQAVEACRLLGRRGILLTKYVEQLPDALPSCVRHCEFAPFQQLFPECAAIVHHGGIGTTAKALAAGKPQLILPIAFDQFDNATRLKSLGVADWLPRRRRQAGRIAEALADLLTDECRARCRQTAENFGARDALEIAADVLEALASEHAG